MKKYFSSVWLTGMTFIAICVLFRLSEKKYMVLGVAGLATFSLISICVSTYLNFRARKWIQVFFGLGFLTLATGLAYFVIQMFVGLSRMDQDSGLCKERKILVENSTIQTFGTFRSEDGSTVLWVCMNEGGLLEYRLTQNDRLLLESDINAPGEPEIVGNANPALVSSRISVYQKWGMIWHKEILWIYSGDVGCFSWQKEKGKYGARFESCERTLVGYPSTTLGKIYQDTHN